MLLKFEHKYIVRFLNRLAVLLIALSFVGQPLAAQATSSKDDAPNAQRRKLVLCLGGGGSRGIAHVGVLRKLEQNGIKPDAVVGTSIGAIVGGLYATGMTPDEIESLLLDRSLFKSYLTVPISLRLALIPIFFIPHLFGYHPYDGLYRGGKFASYIENCQQEHAKSVLDMEKLPMPFVAVCSDLLSAKPYLVTQGTLGRALQASAAIPALRRPVPMDTLNGNKKPDKDCPPDNQVLLIDGGIQANIPVLEARKYFAERPDYKDAVYVASDVDESFPRLKPKDFRKIGSVSRRSVSMFLAQIDVPQVQAADLVIKPDLYGIGLLTGKKKEGLRAIRLGEEAVPDKIEPLKKLLYGSITIR
jgi:NTE family protein